MRGVWRIYKYTPIYIFHRQGIPRLYSGCNLLPLSPRRIIVMEICFLFIFIISLSLISLPFFAMEKSPPFFSAAPLSRRSCRVLSHNHRIASGSGAQVLTRKIQFTARYHEQLQTPLTY